jgi:hypothetical protein
VIVTDDEFKVHGLACAAPPARSLKRRNSELGVLKVVPELWEWAVLAADGDYSRIEIVSETEVIICNHSRGK